MTLRILFMAAALLATPGVSAAEELTGCSAFRWPVERERAALANTTKPVVLNGGALRNDSALTLQLAPYAEASLPHAPERAPRVTPSFAGHFTLSAPTKPGVYKVTLASKGWVDVIDNGAFLHPKGFSGAVGCEGARKSVTFALPGRPVDVQLSNVKDADIAVIVTSAE
jgi:hypothetical protein